MTQPHINENQCVFTFTMWRWPKLANLDLVFKPFRLRPNYSSHYSSRTFPTPYTSQDPISTTHSLYRFLGQPFPQFLCKVARGPGPCCWWLVELLLPGSVRPGNEPQFTKESPKAPRCPQAGNKKRSESDPVNQCS